MITTKLDQIEKRSNEIQTALQNPDTMKDMKKFAELSRELSSYDKVLNCYHEWKKLEESIPDLKKMAQEKDEEISKLKQKIKEMSEELEKKEVCAVANKKEKAETDCWIRVLIFCGSSTPVELS